MATPRFAVVLVLVSGLVGPAPEPSSGAERGSLTASIEHLLEQREYEATENGVGLQAPNRAHNLRSYFEPTGVRVIDRTATDAPELVTLRLSGIGRGDALASVPEGVVSSAAHRVEIRRPGVVEWYVNSAAGLEHGFTLDAPPVGSGAVAVELAVGAAAATLRGDRVVLRTSHGRVLEYAKLAAFDATGRALPAYFETPSSERLRLVVDDDEARYPLTIDPLLTGVADSTFTTAVGAARLGASVASAGDINGDGYADAIIGAPLWDGGQTDEGAVFLYHGSPTGLGALIATIQSNQISANFGESVAGAGDVNGDGYPDVIVGAPKFDGSDSDDGAAFVFHGGAAGILGGTPSDAAVVIVGDQFNIRFGGSVASAGDVNADGYADVIVGAKLYASSQSAEGGAFVYHGSPAGIGGGNTPDANATIQSNQVSAELGVSVAGAGDVNGDGYSDVIVGSSLYDTGGSDEGAAFVFLGGASGIANGNPSTAIQLESNQSNSRFGESVAAAGDVNGDGYGDLIVGAYQYDLGQTDEGAGFVFHGGPLGPITNNPTNANTVLQSNYSFALMGRSVASAGDVDGDGYADVIVGSEDDVEFGDSNGAVYVFRGGAAGVSSTFYRRPSLTPPADEFGYSVAGVGDVNGDGYADVIIGAPLNGVGGAAFVLHGGGAGLVSGSSPTAARSILSGQFASTFGTSLASAGDVNADGFGDLIVGAPNYDAGTNDEGAAFVFLGSASGISGTAPASAATQIEGNAEFALLGESVSSAGDVNGDGYDDVIVGSPGHTNTQVGEGGAFVFHGGASGLAPTGTPASANSALRSGQDSAALGGSVASAGDVNGDGFADVIAGAEGWAGDGGAFLWYGSSSGLVANGTPANANALIASTVFMQLGYRVAGAGDLNGDGYSDVAISALEYQSGQASEGGVFVFHGSASGVIASGNQTNANATVQPDQTFVFAAYVASAGDVNGDGYGDLITGAPGYDGVFTNDGAAFLYYGGPGGIGNGTPENADATFRGNGLNHYFGDLLSSAGDVNGDGFADLLLGSGDFSDVATSAAGAYLFLGRASAFPTSTIANAAAMFVLDEPTTPLSAAAGIGDVNGDGFADIGIGARTYGAGGSDPGAAFLHYGAGNRNGRPVRARQLRGGGSALNVAPWGVSNSNFGFDVRLDATHPQGRGRVKLQVQVCPTAVAFGHASCTTQTETSWTHVTPPTANVMLTRSISGLSANTLRRWRARVLHAPANALVDSANPPHGPWRHLRARSSEADIRTANFPDTDSDGVPDPSDNCVSVPNPSQLDTDGDQAGDACDTDDDDDGLLDDLETGTGTYVSPGDTGSDPLDADSDDDGFVDGFEVRGDANPIDAASQPLFTGFDRLDGGLFHSCGLLTNGEAICFGNASSAAPSGTFRSITTGSELASNACGLRTDDTIACWGSGTGTPSSVSYLQIAAGAAHACGLLPDLTLECWGSNSSGQAAPPAGLFSEVSSGDAHSCALGLDGSARCWGSNGSGQATVPAGETFVEVVGGSAHSCGLRADGSVLCWGSNAAGQTTVSPGTYTQIVSGGFHACGRLASGDLACWGSNSSGQATPPSGPFAAVFAGANHSCGIRANHRAECWGLDTANQASPPILPFPDVALGESHGCELSPASEMRCFGSDDLGQASPPVAAGVLAIGVGAEHSCAIQANGDIDCFGANTAGESADQSAAGDPFVQVDGGFGHTCAVRASGEVACWGSNLAGQRTPDAGSYRQVSAGGTNSSNAHTCGITTAGALRCWGTNTVGQATDQGGSWTQVSAGQAFSCGVRTDATLGCFGQNTFGQATPPAGAFAHVEAGRFHACALAHNGTMRCWGDAADGKTAPPPGSYERISVNGDASCGVLEDGSIVCWGVDSTDPSPALDVDDDNRAEGGDNCPIDANVSQDDGDADGVGDACDLCPATPDPDRFDRDDDGVGDACDNCADVYNPGQEDDVGPPNGIGNACEDTLVIIRPALPPPPPGPPPGAPSGPGAPPPPPAGEALYDVFLYCPAGPVASVQLGVIMPQGTPPQDVNFGLGCTALNCNGAVGQGLGANVSPANSFAVGPGVTNIGARSDTVYFSMQAMPAQVLCPSSGPTPEIEVRVAQFWIANPLTDTPTPSLTTEGLTSVGLLAPLTDDTGRVLEPAEYAFTSLNQDPSVALTLEPAPGGVPGHRWQVELDTDIELHRVTFGLVAPVGTTTTQMRFIGCTTASGPQPTRRSCSANGALGPYVAPATSFTVGPGASTSGLRPDTLYISVGGARASGAPLPALNISTQPVILGVVELDTTTAAPALTLEGVGTTSVFGPAYVDSSNTTVTTPLVQVGGGYNAASDYDADGRSDDLDNCPYTANVNQANNGGFLTTTPDLYGDTCQCADGDGNGSVFAQDTLALRQVLTGQASPAVMSRCSVAGGPECDVRDYAVFRRALAGLGPGISSVCASAVQGTQLPAAP